MRCVLRYGDKWHLSRAAAEADPSCTLAQLLLCDFCIAWCVVAACSRAQATVTVFAQLVRWALPYVRCAYTRHSSDLPAAQAAWAAASKAASASAASTRDVWYLCAWQAWLAGDLESSARLFGQVLVHTPSDLFALKRAQLLYFLCGKLPSMLTVCAYNVPCAGPCRS